MPTDQPTSISRSPKRVSMRDVATRCGVSISTVSLVLSGDVRIPEDTTRKVLQTVKALEYRPSMLARSLARRGSRTIGVILPEWGFQKNQSFYYQVLAGIHSRTQPAGYKMLVEAANQNFLDRRYYLRLLKEQSADGIIYLAASRDDSFLSDMKREHYPFILLGNRVDGVELPFIGGRDAVGAAMATAHLISGGHIAIGYVGGPPVLSMFREREQGYRDAMAKASLPVDPRWVISVGFMESQLEPVLSGLLASGVTAIFAGSDVLAAGVLSRLHQLKKSVPGDIAVVGMDGLEFSEWLNPPLTTVQMNISKMAAMATDYVLKTIQSLGAPPVSTLAVPDPELIVRSSADAA